MTQKEDNLVVGVSKIPAIFLILIVFIEMSLVAWKSRISKREGCTGIILFLEWHSAIFIHMNKGVSF